MSRNAKYGRVRLSDPTPEDFAAIEPGADCQALAEHFGRDIEQAEGWDRIDIFEHVDSPTQHRWLRDSRAKEIQP